jgi:predicted transposase YbfD/YdcC
MKKYSKIKDKLNKETIINEKSVKELETILSKLNSKTCDYNKFKTYCIEKNKLNYQLYSHYEQRCFRKFKLNAFTNTQKSENKMRSNFQNKYGKPEETIFVMGDYDKGDYNMKGKEPVICKKFRRIFRNAGYTTFLVNEFRTSKLCNCCNEELEYFLERPSKKPKLIKEGKTEICHGLLRCQSIKHKSEIFHNRDKNAVQNMLNIVKSVLNTGKRPDIFCREIHS